MEVNEAVFFVFGDTVRLAACGQKDQSGENDVD